MQLDHINIRAPRVLLDEVKDFYCAVLGLEEGYRPGLSGPGYWLYAEKNPLIHLSADEQRPAAGADGNLDHVAFRVSDLGPVIGALEQLGVEVRSVYNPDVSLRQLFFRDPAGLKIEVNCVEA